MIKCKISEKLHKVADRIEETSIDEKITDFISDASEAYEGFKTSRKERSS